MARSKKRKPIRAAWAIYRQIKTLHKTAVQNGYDDYLTRELLDKCREVAEQIECDVYRKEQ